MSNQSINVTFAGTSSFVFTAPTQQVTILDGTNPKFLRQVFVSNDGVRIVRGSQVVNFPFTTLFNAASAYTSSMTWKPVIFLQPSSTAVVHGANITASFACSASVESGSATYQWQSGSSVLPWYDLTNVSPYGGTTTSHLSASCLTIALNGVGYRCICSGSAGATTSSIATLTVT